MVNSSHNAKIKTTKISSGGETGFLRKFGPAKISRYTVYFISLIRRCGYFFFAACLSTGGWRIFLWKPADINDGWISYVRAIQRWLLDAVSSLAQPLSPAVSRGNELYNTNCPSDSLVTIVRNYLCMCACALLVAVATIRGQHLFHSELPIVRLLFEGGVYSKKYGNSPCYIRISRAPSKESQFVA